MANQDSGPMILKHLLDMQVSATGMLDSGPISINMSLDMTVHANVPIKSGPINMNMELDMGIGPIQKIQNSGSIAMFNLLDMWIYDSETYCMGEVYNFVPQRLVIDTCEEEVEEMIERYEGDTYPVEVVFSRNGNHNISAYTFKMYTQIGEGPIYEADGTIMNQDHGLVIFNLEADAVNTAGEGVYEIKVIAADIATFAHGEFNILDALVVA